MHIAFDKLAYYKLVYTSLYTKKIPLFISKWGSWKISNQIPFNVFCAGKTFPKLTH